MNYTKIYTSLVIILTFLSTKIIAQNAFQNLKIYQEVNLNSKTFSKADTRIIKMPNGQTATVNNIGGSKLSKYERYSEIEFKPNKEDISIRLKTKRIKNNSNGIEIDTDLPYANNPQTQVTLDYYVNQLGFYQIKVPINRLQSPKPSDETVWKGPLLNPIHELSGIYLSNSNIKLEKGLIWSDTIKGKFNYYVNNYEVLEIEDKKAKILLKGKLEKLGIQSIIENETSDFDKLIKSNDTENPSIEPTVVIQNSKYTGNLLVTLDTRFINEMNLVMNREETSTMFGMAVPKTLETNILVKNKML